VRRLSAIAELLKTLQEQNVTLSAEVEKLSKEALNVDAITS
jgi:hypothetical protein